MINLRRQAAGVFDCLADRLIKRALTRPADFVVGGHADPYMLRWWLTPWSGWYRDIPGHELTWWQWVITRLPGAYLHRILRSDDDRALHDHPWLNVSILLDGEYLEHTILPGGIHERRRRIAGDFVVRRAKTAHRLEVIQPVIRNSDGTVSRVGPRIKSWSLFLFGFRWRQWGFHCPERGWVHWREFTAADDRGSIGKGCEG